MSLRREQEAGLFLCVTRTSSGRVCGTGTVVGGPFGHVITRVIPSWILTRFFSSSHWVFRSMVCLGSYTDHGKGKRVLIVVSILLSPNFMFVGYEVGFARRIPTGMRGT